HERKEAAGGHRKARLPSRAANPTPGTAAPGGLCSGGVIDRIRGGQGLSTANFVPEVVTLNPTGNPPEGLGFRHVLFEGVARFRAADATSIARALGFQVVLSAIPAVIAVVAIATRLGEGVFRDLILSIFDSVAPGSTADLFRSVVQQGSDAASSNLWVI